MEHFYQGLDGWFDYQEIYSRMVAEAEDGSRFVEVGVYQGKSAAYMAVEIANSGKDIRFDCIDIEMDVAHMQSILSRAGDFVTAMRGDSVSMSNSYEDESLDFVWIDADHSPAAINADINAWLPKVKPGGYIGGHDWSPNHYNGIHEACDRLIPGYELYVGDLWASHQVKSFLFKKPE